MSGATPQYESERNKRPYTNRDGPGNTTIDYGPRKGSQQDSFDQKREKYGNSPWFGDQGNPLPWSGPDGQQVGQRTPFYTPSSLDPRNAGYWQGGQPDLDWDGDISGIKNYMGFTDADMLELREDPAFVDSAKAFMQARHSGNTKAAVAAMMKLKQSARPTGGTGNPAPRGGGDMQRFIDQGGSAETWRDRHNRSWPVPRAPSGNYQYGPGRPGPTPPGVSRGGASGGGGAPPQRGPIEIEGYQPSGGGGGFPRGGMGTGGGETGSMYDNPMSPHSAFYGYPMFAQGGPWGPRGSSGSGGYSPFDPGYQQMGYDMAGGMQQMFRQPQQQQMQYGGGRQYGRLR